MKKKRLYSGLLIFILVLIGCGLLFINRPKDIAKHRVNESQVKEVQNIADIKGVVSQVISAPDLVNNAPEENNPRSAQNRKNGPKNASEMNKRISQPAARYLDREEGEYTWSSSVFAVHASAFSGNMDTVVGKIGNMLVVPADAKPANSFFVVRKKDSSRIGFYTNKVIAISDKSEIKKIIAESGRNYNYLAGSYIVTVPEIQEAIEFLDRIKLMDPDAQVDLDINIYVNRPK